MIMTQESWMIGLDFGSMCSPCLSTLPLDLPEGDSQGDRCL